MSNLLAINRLLVRNHAFVMLGLFCALAGAGLATGIMAYGAIVDGEEYTTQSWVLIPPVWLGLAALWWVTVRWPFVGGLPLGALAFYAGGFFSDVYGQFPAGLLLLLGAAVILAAATETEDSQTSFRADARNLALEKKRHE